MELFRSANIDWLGKKWYFLGFSLIFSVAGLISIFFWHGIPTGVDFKGGTAITVQFDSTPHEDDIMRAVRSFDPCLPCGVHMYLGDGKVVEQMHTPTVYAGLAKK